VKFIISDKLIESLSERQKKIYNLLEINQDKSSIAYLGAIRVLQDEINPDRFHQAANSIRHIGALFTRSEIRKKQSKKSRHGEFRRKLKKVLTEEIKFLHPDIIGNINNSIDKWQSLHKFFIGIAHYSDRDFSEFEEKLREIEEILLELLKTSGERQKILESLLKINQPKQEHVDLLKSAILFPADANYFFNNLKSPNWLGILKVNNFFSSPSNEFSRHFNISSWPQANYLISISDTKPRNILQIFNEYKEFRNFLVFRRLLLCVLNMPVDIAQDSIPLINLWARNILPNTELMTLQKIFVKFIKGSELKAALKLLEIMFNFKYPKIQIERYPQYNKYYLLLRSDLGDFQDTLTNINDGYFYYKFINILSKCLSEAIRADIIELAKMDEEIYGVKTQITPELLLSREHSEIIRESIETLPESYESDNVVNLLINKIRNFTLALYSLDKGAFIKSCKSFLKFKWKTFTRLFLFMLDKHYDLLKPSLLEILKRKEIFEGSQCWHEYFHLLKNHFLEFDEDQQQIIFNWIEEGPKFNIPETNFENKQEYEQIKAQIIKKWRKRRLIPVKENLPTELSTKFKQILNDAKSLKYPDFLRKKSGVSIYSPSNLHLKEVKDMKPEDQMEYLKNFKPNRESFPYLKGREGLGEAYCILIKGNPSSYISYIQNFNEIPSKFLPDIIDGFRKALEDNNLEDVAIVLESLSKISKFIDLIRDSKEGFRIEFALVQFIEEMLNKASPELVIEHKNLIWTLNLPRSKKQDFVKYKDSNQFRSSPLIFYLYTIDGLKLINMINLLETLVQQTDKGEETSIFKEFFKMAEERLDFNLENAELIRAIFGYRFDALLRIDKVWTQKRLDTIFPDAKERRNLWDVAWDSYILTHHFSRPRFSLLKPLYKKSINRLNSGSPNLTFDGRLNLLRHLISAYLMDIENLEKDSLIDYFFLTTNPDIRRLMWQILFNIIDEINQIEDIKRRETLLKKYFELLNYRIDYLKQAKIDYKDLLTELEPFGMMFTKIINIDTYHLTLLNDILKLTKGNIGIFTSNILDIIRNILEIDTTLILEILHKLVVSDNQSIWLDNRMASMIFDMVNTVTNKELSQPSALLVKRINEEMWKRGYHQFSNEK